jgi:5-methyltetrahydrofolate--homocysteine methyltransferase
LLVGGATTSKLHAALKIAPKYSGPVVWAKDAAQSVLVSSRLLNAKERQTYINELNNSYEALRKQYAEETERIASLEEARRNKLNLF